MTRALRRMIRKAAGMGYHRSENSVYLRESGCGWTSAQVILGGSQTCSVQNQADKSARRVKTIFRHLSTHPAHLKYWNDIRYRSVEKHLAPYIRGFCRILTSVGSEGIAQTNIIQLGSPNVRYRYRYPKRLLDLRIRIQIRIRIRVLPSSTKNNKKTLGFYYFVTSLWLFICEEWYNVHSKSSKVRTKA